MAHPYVEAVPDTIHIPATRLYLVRAGKPYGRLATGHRMRYRAFLGEHWRLVTRNPR